ncbi:MAG: cyclic nucleotide-binding domain-containing protein, partial [Cyanobacteria bacterium J06649_4]
LPQANIQSIINLLPQIRVLHYGPNSVVIQAGDIADFFYVVVTGTLDVIKNTEKGEEVVIRQLKPGDYFGEIALVKEIQRSATIRVTGEKVAKLITLDRTMFRKLLDESINLEPQMKDAFEKQIRDEVSYLSRYQLKERSLKGTSQKR